MLRSDLRNGQLKHRSCIGRECASPLLAMLRVFEAIFNRSEQLHRKRAEGNGRFFSNLVALRSAVGSTPSRYRDRAVAAFSRLR